MRTLTEQELECVAGGIEMGVCTPSNSYGGVTDPGSIGSDLINFYEGTVYAMSHVIERVANAL